MNRSVNKVTPTRSEGERDLISHVSRRVRVLRRERGLSLDQLASKASVSKGMLVQLEKGEGNPSIATLCKVAASIGASVADLVHLDAQQAAAVVPAGPPRVLWRGPKGGSATFLVGSSGPDMIELWSWELRPGERYEAAAHPEGTQELVHVVHGTLGLEFGPGPALGGAGAANVHMLGAGGSATARTDRPHAYVCVGKKPVRFTMVVAEWHDRRRGRPALGAGRRRRSS